MDLNVDRIEDNCEICGEKSFFSKYAPKKICCNCQSDLASDRWKRYRKVKKRYVTSGENHLSQTPDI